MLYKAFISYSHAADGKLAPGLRQALQRFAKIWYRRRALRVFRDESSLAVTPALWPSIENALAESEFFILLASQEASASHWVQQEIQYWLENKPFENFLIVLTEGEIAWDDSARDFDWLKTTALPVMLRHVFADEPLYLDLRWARRSEHLSNRHPDFRNAIARLAATLHRRPLDELAGEDVRQHRVLMRIMLGGVTALILATIGAMAFAYLASINQKKAVDRRFVSVAQALAARAPGERTESHDDERAALAARQAFLFNAAHGGLRLSEIDQALRRVLGEPYFSVRFMIPETELTAIAVSPNSQLVAVAGRDQSVRVWNRAERDTPPVELTHDSGDIRALAFGADQTTLLAVTDIGDLLSWHNVAAGQRVVAQRLRGAAAEYGAYALSSGGEYLAAARLDGPVDVWNLGSPTSEPIQVCCHPGRARVSALAFASHAGDSLATGAKDNAVNIWSLSNPAAPHTRLTNHDGPITALAFRGDGNGLAVGTALHMPELLTSLRQGVEEYRPVGGSVVVWNLARAQPSGETLGHHAANVVALAFSAGGDELASTGGGDRLLRLWDLTAQPPEASDLHGHSGTISGLAFAPDDSYLASVDSGDRGVTPSSVRLWNLGPPPGAPVTLEGHNGAVVAVAFSPTEERLASASSDGTVRIWDLGSGQPVAILDHGEELAAAVVYSPEGTTIATGTASPPGGSYDFDVRLWGPEHTETPRHVLGGHSSSVDAVAFSADGAWIASAGNTDGQILLWKRSDPDALPRILDAHTSMVPSLAFHPTAPLLAWGSKEGVIRLVNVTQSDAEPRVIPGHHGLVTALAFRPGEDALASGGIDGKVMFWRLDKPAQKPLAAKGQQGPVRALAIDRQGKALATGSTDGIVRVWPLGALDSEPVALHAESGAIYAVAFSADDQLLAAGTANHRVVVWRRTEPLLQSVCDMVWRNFGEDEWKRFVGPDVACTRTCEKLPTCQ